MVDVLVEERDDTVPDGQTELKDHTHLAEVEAKALMKTLIDLLKELVVNTLG